MPSKCHVENLHGQIQLYKNVSEDRYYMEHELKIDQSTGSGVSLSNRDTHTCMPRQQEQQTSPRHSGYVLNGAY